MKKTALQKINAVTSLQKAMLNFEKNSALRQFIAHADKHQAALKMLEGPFADLKRAGILDEISSLKNVEMECIKKLAFKFETRFYLPEVSIHAKILAEYKVSPLFKALKSSRQSMASIQKAMEAMHSPWLDSQRKLQSLNAFAELQGIGAVLKNARSFEDSITETLRIGLGDWRDQITWPKDIFTDYEVRSSFYEERGFNSALTNFPSEAFEESLEIAEIHGQLPTLIDQYGEPVPRSDNQEEEEGFHRTNVAHDWLIRFETHIRRFIDILMTQRYGDAWPKHRLPNDLYDKWQNKREKSEKAGRQVFPLISYCDFTEYELIICRRDNWKEVFSDFFVRQENVRESFQRLYPVRIDTMHARLITQDDELLLFAEVKRIMNVLGASIE